MWRSERATDKISTRLSLGGRVPGLIGRHLLAARALRLFPLETACGTEAGGQESVPDVATFGVPAVIGRREPVAFWAADEAAIGAPNGWSGGEATEESNVFKNGILD